MKRKFAAITLGLVLGAVTISGCNKTNTNDTQVSESKENTEDKIYGEVKKVGSSSVTIETGTMKEMEQPAQTKDGQQSSSADSSEKSDETEKSQPQAGGEMPSMLDLTGEEQEIRITDDTVITRQGMGGQPGEMPEKPEGETSDSEMPEKPEGEAPGMQEAEKITLEDISEGDTISVTLDEDGNAAEIIVMSMGGGINSEKDKF